MTRALLSAGAAFGLIGVVLGAFGAHALRVRLSAEMLSVWKTGVDYQLVHALALLVVGVLLRQGLAAAPALQAAGVCFVAGIVLFSGSLYALTLTDVRALGAITPIGGVLFLAGWALLLYAVVRG